MTPRNNTLVSMRRSSPSIQFWALNEHASPTHADLSQPMRYQIRVEGHLGPQWANWFEGVEMTLEAAGTTRIDAAQLDQAALFGVLKKVRDLGMPLISVVRLAPPIFCAKEASTGEKEE